MKTRASLAKLCRLGGVCLAFLLPLLLTSAQETRLPTQADVKALQEKFQAERAAVLKGGADKRFMPILVQKAEEMAKKADTALGAGRLLQAAEYLRQARWQLPYQSAQVPREHVSRVLGNLRLRHGMEVYAIDFSPDGQLLASGSRDRSVKVWDLANGHELLTYTGHADSVRAVAFHPKESLIASAGGDRDIKLWDPRSGKDVRTLKGEGEYVTGLAFSKDGKYLVTSQAGQAGKNPGLVCIYETATGNLKRKIDDFRLMVHHVAFNHDGTILGVGDGTGLTRLYQFPNVAENAAQPEYWSQADQNGATYHLSFSQDNRTLVRIGADGIKFYNLVLPGAPFQVSAPRRHILALASPHRYTCAVFNRDGRVLYTGSTDGIIRVWDVETGQVTGTFKGHNSEIKSLMFNPGGSQLASGSTDYTIRLWDFDIVLQSRDYAGHKGPVWTAQYDAQGSRVVTASADRTIKIRDANSGEQLAELTGHKSAVTYALFSADGNFILSGSGDRTVKLWEASSGKHLKDLEGHDGTITALDYDKEGKRAASGGADKLVRIWDVASGKILVKIDDNKSVVAGVAFSPDGKQLAVANVDQTIKLYDASTGKLEHSWIAHGTATTGLAYSPNGQYLASCGADHLVKVWPLAKPGTTPITLSGHTGPLSSVAFRNDNQHLVSCGADTTVKLWKLEGATGKEAQTFRGHKDWVSSAAFSKDGYYVISCGVDRLVKIWEITSREIPLITEHTGSVDAIAFSPDGKLLASGASDKTIKIWDRATGVELHTLHGHGAGVLSLAFTPDSKTLFSSSIDRNIRMWEVPIGKPITLIPGQQHAFTGLISPVPYLIVPDDKRLIAWVPGNERYTDISVWEFANGNEQFSPDPLRDKDRNIAAVSFSANGKLAATGARDGSVRLFDLTKKHAKEALVPGGEWFVYEKGKSVGDIALSPGGSALVVSSEAGDVKICNVAKREVLKSFKAHDSRVMACLISPDGKRFVTAGLDNMIRLWDLGTGEKLREWDFRARIQERGAFVSSLAFSPDGKHLATGNSNTTIFLLDLP